MTYRPDNTVPSYMVLVIHLSRGMRHNRRGELVQHSWPLARTANQAGVLRTPRLLVLAPW